MGRGARAHLEDAPDFLHVVDLHVLQYEARFVGGCEAQVQRRVHARRRRLYARRR